MIAEQRVSSKFGDTAFRDLQIAESAYHSLGFSSTYLNGEEFQNMTDDEVSDMVTDNIADAERRSIHLFRKGLSERQEIDAAGLMQTKIGLEEVLQKGVKRFSALGMTLTITNTEEACAE